MKPPHGAWREDVKAEVAHVKGELGARNGDAEHALGLLSSVTATADKPGSLLTWWTGEQQVRAWQLLHEAEAEIPKFLSKDELYAHSEGVLKQAHAALSANDPQVTHLSKLINDPDRAASYAALAAETSDLTWAVHYKLDETHRQRRACRNRLILLTGIGLVGVTLLIVATALGPIDLNSASQTGIPSGWEIPLLLALFGAMGAFVSSVPALSRIKGAGSPSGLVLYQLLLKLTTGALFAFFGIVMLQSGVINKPIMTHTLLGLLVWAAIFGSSQQTVTRLVDRKVSVIGSGTSN